ncbi:MAG: glycogen debranching protein GlgX [Brevinematales bacterium]|nr:glycogen debranching protein GlgX [Brevinematales bacterium]
MNNKTEVKTSAGEFFPLGATYSGKGVNFALFSRNATGVELLLFDKSGDDVPSAVIPIRNRTRFVWHVFVEGMKPGQLYGYRVFGRYAPEEGYRFNPNRLLVDPYAKAIDGHFAREICHLGYDPNSHEADLSFNSNPNFKGAPKSVVIDDSFEWDGDRHPYIPMNETILYEAHVKGLTMHRSSKSKFPGTYAGAIDAIPYLKDLGVTSVELLPVHHCQEEDFLLSKGMTNYWGYNTLGYFAPDSRYSTGSAPGSQVREFKEMVRAMHAAGLEVILDVVYNHTCEGNEKGNTYSFKGIDNQSYYKLAQNKRYYTDFTGCGNSLNFGEPQVIKLVMDSLRYWVQEMHVDGFRFDLASVLGREQGSFDQVSAFFTAIHQDPVLSPVKLIAEPWDIAWDSYQVGNFPVDWAEWNGRYRDTVRRFMKGDSGLLGEIGARLTGSPDLYSDDGRTPYHSINFITCHDGFSLYDLVAYNGKHNEANGEDNRDGTNDNNSWNCGYEGETADPEINRLRRRMMKNYIAFLLISQGTPMLLGGDEFMRTQRGNNNSYCQDNDINYLDWDLMAKNRKLVDFTKKLIAYRHKRPHFRNQAFFTGLDTDGSRLGDINWYDVNLNAPNWNDGAARTIAFLIEGEEITGGRESIDVFVMINMFWGDIPFVIPPCPKDDDWTTVMDTSQPDGNEFNGATVMGSYNVRARSIVILERKK